MLAPKTDNIAMALSQLNCPRARFKIGMTNLGSTSAGYLE
jgi:hypothetical protein